MVALSSGEAELYGIAESVMTGLHVRYIAEELGLIREDEITRCGTDSTAAQKFWEKKGIGSEMKHIDLRSAWIKDIEEGSNRIKVKHIKRTLNGADMLTKVSTTRETEDWYETYMVRVK